MQRASPTKFNCKLISFLHSIAYSNFLLNRLKIKQGYINEQMFVRSEMVDGFSLSVLFDICSCIYFAYTYEMDETKKKFSYRFWREGGKGEGGGGIGWCSWNCDAEVALKQNGHDSMVANSMQWPLSFILDDSAFYPNILFNNILAFTCSLFSQIICRVFIHTTLG